MPPQLRKLNILDLIPPELKGDQDFRFSLDIVRDMLWTHGFLGSDYKITVQGDHSVMITVNWSMAIALSKFPVGHDTRYQLINHPPEVDRARVGDMVRKMAQRSQYLAVKEVKVHGETFEFKLEYLLNRMVEEMR